MFHVEQVTPDTIGKRLRVAMAAAGAKNADVADWAGVHVKTVSQWLGDRQQPTDDNLRELAPKLSTSWAWLRYGAVAYDPADPETARRQVSEKRFEFSPQVLTEYLRNAAFKRRLPPRVYERVYSYIDILTEKGAAQEQIEEAERLMADSAYNKLNARDFKERTEDDMLLDVDDAWDYIKEVLTRAGLKGL